MNTQWTKDFLPEMAPPRAGGPLRGFTPQTGLRRGETEAFIAAVFRRAYGARIAGFMPVLLGLRDGGSRLLAACGLRAGAGNALFLERYLDAPVEGVLGAAIRRAVAREAIIEVGNLAVVPPGSARHLIVALTGYLAPTRLDWVVFTAAPALRNAFTRLGIPLAALADASIDRLPADARADWGTYYVAGPKVCAVSIAAARDALLQLDCAGSLRARA
jgi:hypothetical protein